MPEQQRKRGVLPSRAASPLIALALLGASALAACNTVEGVGEDVEAAGQAVDEAAEEAAEDAQDTPD